MSLRAEIVETGNPELKSASIIINASAKEIFDLLANPAMHQVIDGSHSVRGVLSAPDRLYLGAKFGMKMKIGVKYRITNTVIEWDENRLIAWRHLGRWVWRYELQALSANQTAVTESFDSRPTPLKAWLRMRKAHGSAQIAIAKTLVRLKKEIEGLD
jgi:hypothetical protein